MNDSPFLLALVLALALTIVVLTQWRRIAFTLMFMIIFSIAVLTIYGTLSLLDAQ